MELRQAWRNSQTAQPHLEDGTAYSPKQVHRVPSHSSKTVLSTVKIGPPNWTKSRTFTLRFRLSP